MSRAGAGFADFFPTAPSVLQQKQRQAALERQQRLRAKAAAVQQPSPGKDADATAAAAAATASPRSGAADAVAEATLANAGGVGDASDRPTPNAADDSDSVQGDLLNGVGSTSSDSSTASSVFSSSHVHVAATSSLGMPTTSHVLTPLTTAESSPPDRCSSPLLHKPPMTLRASHETELNGSSLPRRHALGNSMDPTLTPRPHETGPRIVKGRRCVYDPELDKTLSPKERKRRKPIYRSFGAEVRR